MRVSTRFYVIERDTINGIPINELEFFFHLKFNLRDYKGKREFYILFDKQNKLRGLLRVKF